MLMLLMNVTDRQMDRDTANVVLNCVTINQSINQFFIENRQCGISAQKVKCHDKTNDT